jgi:hypothetical protein
MFHNGRYTLVGRNGSASTAVSVWIGNNLGVSVVKIDPLD